MQPTARQIEEHAARIAWNAEMVNRLGLTIVKDSRQIKSITLTQGNMHFFHVWSSHGGQWTSFELHKQLENFLKAYMEYLLNFPGVTESGVGAAMRVLPTW